MHRDNNKSKRTLKVIEKEKEKDKLTEESQAAPCPKILPGSDSLLTIFMERGTKKIVKKQPSDPLSLHLEKICFQRELDPSKYMPRDMQGNELSPDTPCTFNEITYMIKDNLEGTMVEELCSVAWNNEVPTLVTLLSLPCYQNVVNMPNQRGQCALYCASRKGNVDIVITLLKCFKVDVNFQVAEHGAASFGGNSEIVVLLLSRGADINLKNKLGLTARQEAQGKEMMDVYKTLDNSGLDKLKKSYTSVIKLEKELGRMSISQLTKSVQNSVSLDAYRSGRSQLYSPEVMWIWYEHFAESLDILDLSPIEIAQQMTLIDHKLFDAIRPYELISGGYAKADKEMSAPNICRSTNYFNLVGAWVSTEILKVPDLSARIVVLSFVIEVLQNLIKYNNLTSSFAVQLALRTSAIYRLTETLSGVTEYLQQYVQVVVELCNPEHNFAPLRRHLEEHPPPGLPYLGMYLKDLIFINDGNKDGPAKDNMIQTVLDQVSSWQKQPVAFKAIPRMQNMLLNAWSLTEEKRFDMSLLLEPRVKKGEILTQEEKDEEQRLKEEAVQKAKQLLSGELAEVEATHYKNINERANMTTMINIILETPTDIQIPTKEAPLPSHRLLILPRSPVLLEVAEGEGETKREIWDLLKSSTPTTVQALLNYIIRDDVCHLPLEVLSLQPQCDQISAEDVFDLWALADALSLKHLSELVHVYVYHSQTKQNVSAYAMLQIKHNNFKCWKPTHSILKKNVNLIYSSSIEFKSQVQAAMKKYEQDNPVEPALSITPSTWKADYTPVLQRSKFTDISIILRDVFGYEQRLDLHRCILKSQLTFKKTFMMRTTAPTTDTATSPSRTLVIDVAMPISTFMKILDFAYTRHFGAKLLDNDKIFILCAGASLIFHNMGAISNLLLLDIKHSRVNSTEVVEKFKVEVDKISDIKKCAALRNYLQTHLSSHPLVKVLTDHTIQLHHAHALLLPSITAATSQLNARITELEEENTKLRAALGSLTDGNHPLLQSTLSSPATTSERKSHLLTSAGLPLGSNLNGPIDGEIEELSLFNSISLGDILGVAIGTDGEAKESRPDNITPKESDKVKSDGGRLSGSYLHHGKETKDDKEHVRATWTGEDAQVNKELEKMLYLDTNPRSPSLHHANSHSGLLPAGAAPLGTTQHSQSMRSPNSPTEERSQRSTLKPPAKGKSLPGLPVSAQQLTPASQTTPPTTTRTFEITPRTAEKARLSPRPVIPFEELEKIQALMISDAGETKDLSPKSNSATDNKDTTKDAEDSDMIFHRIPTIETPDKKPPQRPAMGPGRPYAAAPGLGQTQQLQLQTLHQKEDGTSELEAPTSPKGVRGNFQEADDVPDRRGTLWKRTTKQTSGK